MQTKSFNNLESTFLSKFNEGFKTFETLRQNVPFDETTLNSIIEKMLANNIIKFDANKKEYIYDTPVNGDMVILDGNIMLPCTIIKTEDKLFVSRGPWYTFDDPNFDIRRIIWNVQLPNSKKSTLTDLIKESVLKVRKSKIVQLPEYQKLINLMIPWSENIMLQINTVGSDFTDVSIVFREKLLMEKNSTDFIEFRGLTTRSEIKTQQLIEQLTCPVQDRKFNEIELNRIFNFTDFVFSGNSIPYNKDSENIEYVKITAIKGKIELTYFNFDKSGQNKKLSSETYIDISEGIAKLRELFQSYTENLLLSLDFLVEDQNQ